MLDAFVDSTPVPSFDLLTISEEALVCLAHDRKDSGVHHPIITTPKQLKSLIGVSP